ncbi:amidohydrolase [Fibrobacter sp.]|uniref:amidohydrolase n=1 Tax=Fibrobacter sp. TaxID=35828 RepID=UPI00388F802A
MGKILLKSVLMQNAGESPARKDVLIDGNVFSKIVDVSTPEMANGAKIIDCKNLALVPAFYNGHTHAAMSLLRGYADDMELSKWLNEYIWPFEAKLTDREIEIGSRLAVLEMIKSGTVFFSDMYWHREQTMKVVEEMGIRASIGVTISDVLVSPEGLKANFDFLAKHTGESERVKLAVMPHSIYIVSEQYLRRSMEMAEKENYPLHIHLSETEKEVRDCLEQHGCTPVEYLQRLGCLNSRVQAAHCVHFSEKDMEIFAQSGASAILNPNSNLKLSSGIPSIVKMMDRRIPLGLGTDGDSSNNNLDMHEEMKLAALLAKVLGGAETLPASEALKMATINVAQVNSINAGIIAEGKLADGILVRLDNERMVPCFDLISNWVYSADSRAIDSVLCNGRFVMRGGHVDGEEDIVREAGECALHLAENK